MSVCHAPKPRRKLRGKLPCSPAAVGVKAALLKILPPGNCSPKTSIGTPEFTLGRGVSRTPPAKLVAPTMLTGGADLDRTKVSTDQLLSIAFTTGCVPENGTS